MKIGLLTNFCTDNYGCILSAQALSQHIAQEFPNDEVEIINFIEAQSQERSLQAILRADDELRRFRVQQAKHFSEARKQLPLSAKACCLSRKNVDAIRETYAGDYDLLILGSDEYWKLRTDSETPNIFWDPSGIAKHHISYAVSSREYIHELSQDEQDARARGLNKFSYVGVRDSCTYNEIKRLLDPSIPLQMNPDPVFTWDFGNIEERVTKGKKILDAALGPDNHKKRVGITMRANDLYDQVIQSVEEAGWQPISLLRPTPGIPNLNLSVDEWVSVIAALDGMVTNFFHATSFCIKYNTPVVAFNDNLSHENEQSKVWDLLSRLGALERYVFDPEELLERIEPMLSSWEQPLFDEGQKMLADEFTSVIATIKTTLGIA